MIEQFKDNEVRNTGVIYSSVLEQIKGLYAFDPEQAGELAISAIELILTGDMSTDDINIKVMLAPIKKLNEVNVSKYDSKLENQKQKKIVEMKLDMIADLFNKGLKQREIGERMGLSQQVVSYRIDVIKKKYPELLTKIQEDSTKIQTNSQNTKKQNFVQVCTDKSDFVQNSVEESVEPDRKLTPEEARKAAFNF
jgi:predicted transcriptional regulator